MVHPSSGTPQGQPCGHVGTPNLDIVDMLWISVDHNVQMLWSQQGEPASSHKQLTVSAKAAS